VAGLLVYSSEFEYRSAFKNVRWATDFARPGPKRDGLVYVNEVIDCADRSVVGHCISKNARAQETVWPLEDECIKRFGVLPRTDTGVVVLSDNGLVLPRVRTNDF
jgi:hypothetical protein